MPWTPYADLDELMEELLGHWRRILGDGLAGAWIQGSFALGAGDLYSDCDWIVATHARLTEEQVAALRRLHDEIPTREGHWPHDIEGSYGPFTELASVEHLGRRWLFNDHGHRTLEWSDHCNRALHPLDPARAWHHPCRAGTAEFHAPGATETAAS